MRANGVMRTRLLHPALRLGKHFLGDWLDHHVRLTKEFSTLWYG